MAKKRKKSGNRQGLQAVTLCISTAMVLVLLGLVVFSVLTARNLSTYVKQNIVVTMMLQDDMTPGEAKQFCAKLRQRPCPHLSCAPPGGPFLSRQERGKECGLREALTAACSRRRADVLVVRLPPAIDSLDSLRDAPPSLKNPFRRALTVE